MSLGGLCTSCFSHRSSAPCANQVENNQTNTSDGQAPTGVGFRRLCALTASHKVPFLLLLSLKLCILFKNTDTFYLFFPITVLPYNVVTNRNHLLQVEKAIYSASTESAARSGWLCVTEVLLYPLNSETETHTTVSRKTRIPGTSSLTKITFKLVIFCADPPLKSQGSGTLKQTFQTHKEQQNQGFNSRPTHLYQTESLFKNISSLILLVTIPIHIFLLHVGEKTNTCFRERLIKAFLEKKNKNSSGT